MSVQLSRTPNGAFKVVIDGFPSYLVGLNNIKVKPSFKKEPVTQVRFAYIAIIQGDSSIFYNFLFSDITEIDGSAPPGNVYDAADRLADMMAGNNDFVAPTYKYNQVITFGALANRAHTAPAFSADATASSGLGVTYVSSDPTKATVGASTGLITPVAAGSTNITASQAGDANYNAATPVVQALTLT